MDPAPHGAVSRSAGDRQWRGQRAQPAWPCSSKAPGDGAGLEGEVAQFNPGRQVHPEGVPRPADVFGPAWIQAERERRPSDPEPGPGFRPALFEVYRAADTEQVQLAKVPFASPGSGEACLEEIGEGTDHQFRVLGRFLGFNSVPAIAVQTVKMGFHDASKGPFEPIPPQIDRAYPCGIPAHISGPFLDGCTLENITL